MRRIALTALVALLLVACGGESTSSQSAGPDGRTTAVTIENFAFQPQTSDVASRTAVTWTNEDIFGHTVTSGRPGAQTSTFDGVLGETTDGRGTQFRFTFDEPGTYPYFCRFHPTMLGEVRVSG